MAKRWIPAIIAVGLLGAASASAQEPFDACEVFTAADAEAVLGTAASGDPVNPKVRRPKVVTTCNYTGAKDSKAVAANVQFRMSRNENEIAKAFDDHRLQFQTKPMLLTGAEAFWSGKTGQLHVRKGRTWMTIAAGPAKVSERDSEMAKKLAQVLLKKI